MTVGIFQLLLIILIIILLFTDTRKIIQNVVLAIKEIKKIFEETKKTKDEEPKQLK